MNRITKLAITILTSIILSCNTSNEPPKSNNHSRYFPIQDKEEQNFEVLKITIDAPINLYDTVKYETKIITDTVFKTDDRTIGYYTIHKTSSPITASERMVRELTYPIGRYIESYNNCRTIKSLLPVKEGTTWNSKIHCINSDNTPLSKVTKAHRPSTISGMYYDSTIQIVHLYDSSLIHLKVEQEIWATNHGLIYSEITDIVSNSPDIDFTVPIRQRVVKGTIYEVSRKISQNK